MLNIKSKFMVEYFKNSLQKKTYT